MESTESSSDSEGSASSGPAWADYDSDVEWANIADTPVAMREPPLIPDFENWERDSASQLRREQEQEYQRSLAADRAKTTEKKRLLSLEIESQKQAEELRRKEEQDLEDLNTRRAEILSLLPEEPELNGSDVVRASLRFPDGSRIERRFNADDSLEVLFNFAFSNEKCPKDFSLFASYPRKLIRCAPAWYACYSTVNDLFEDPIKTFRSIGLLGSVAIMVQNNTLD